ncbi:MAG: aminoglycoside N-acetyltransferase AAC(6')-Ii [Chloroflexota bacterium]|nr:MAG: aminoglycoside N-acetyltransferase AAC(6')-Ii [Chloroflexota bacterium]
MRIVDLKAEDQGSVQQAAELLVEAFREHWPEAWPDIASALAEVQESFEPGRISRVALADDGTVLGWVGGIRQYDGHVWELHPLVVRPNRQGQGIGRALVADLEAQVQRQGGLTLWLGTDDENNMTSLSGVNLYPNVFDHVAKIKNLRGHPYEFYQKLGFVIVGVMPDANGPGKPDIFMAKFVRPRTADR